MKLHFSACKNAFFRNIVYKQNSELTQLGVLFYVIKFRTYNESLQHRLRR